MEDDRLGDIQGKILDGQIDDALASTSAILSAGHSAPNVELWQDWLQLVKEGTSGYAVEAMARYSANELDRETASLLMMVKAAIAFLNGNVNVAEDLLHSAIESDQENWIARYSLARHLLLTKGEPAAAHSHFVDVARNNPGSFGAHMGLVSLFAETENYDRAAKEALLSARLAPKRAIAWMAYGAARLASSPLQGRAAILVGAGLTFVPYVGPLLVGLWGLSALLSLRVLRRVSLRLATYMPVGYVAILAAYGVRWIFMGRLYP